MNEKERLQRAGELIQAGHYDRARILLEQMPHNVRAQEWLERLEKLDPQPRSYEEASQELHEAREELAAAESDIEKAGKVARRGAAVGLGMLVFLGSLFGSMLGVVADASEAGQTIEEVRSYLFDPEICVVGSNTVLGEGIRMSDEWEDDFEGDNRVRMTVEGIGSTRGVQRAIDGDCAHVLAMSEPMSEEQQQELNEAGVEIACATEIGYDIIVFITDINNPVAPAFDAISGGIDTNILGDVLNGFVWDWQVVAENQRLDEVDYPQPITVLARRGSGTTDIVFQRIAYFYDSQGAEIFPPEATDHAQFVGTEFNNVYSACESNSECLDKALSTPGSLYWVSAAWMSTQPDDYLHVLPIFEGDETSVNPLRDRVDIREYPKSLVRPLFMYVLDSDEIDEDELEMSKKFLTYVRGVQGQKILEEYGFYTHFNQPRRVRVDLPEGFGEVGSAERQICK